LKLNISLILNEIEAVKERLTVLEYQNQWCLQLPKGETNPTYGSREGKDLKHTELDFNEWLFEDMAYTRTVVELMKMTRTRYMENEPKSCMSYHKDPSKRIHIPLITDPDCFILVGKTIHHLEVGDAYLVDTTQKHSFINMSKKCKRVHLVGGV